MEKGGQKGGTRDGPTTAVQLVDGDLTAVGISALKVMIINDDGSWFAQGLEIDYAAEGTSMQDVQRRFQEGLAETVYEHLRMHGSIERLLQLAPQDVWRTFWSQARRFKFTQVSFHVTPPACFQTTDELPFPFDQVIFCERNDSQLAA